MQQIQKLQDDKKCMKKVEPSSRSKAIEDIISIGSFMEALVLNHYVLVRKILQGFIFIKTYTHHLLPPLKFFGASPSFRPTPANRRHHLHTTFTSPPSDATTIEPSSSSPPPSSRSTISPTDTIANIKIHGCHHPSHSPLSPQSYHHRNHHHLVTPPPRSPHRRHTTDVTTIRVRLDMEIATRVRLVVRITPKGAFGFDKTT
uniref:Uncharacterized protein n=1 Tax=Tanacetum cinerariifolium TaxID=118510 RepID=A0A6L2NA15_TANCI|nr:hypothetical protein [Tanacetum cinerariifolium]